MLTLESFGKKAEIAAIGKPGTVSEEVAISEPAHWVLKRYSLQNQRNTCREQVYTCVEPCL